MDSTLVPVMNQALAIFGIPVGWLVATTSAVIGYVNTAKALFPRWVNSKWYPAVAGVISLGYSYATLKPDWLAVGIGATALFATQWLSWAVAKKATIFLGARLQ